MNYLHWCEALDVLSELLPAADSPPCEPNHLNQLQACSASSSELRTILRSVAVEKVHFCQNRGNLGDRKCLGKPRTSFVGHPSASSTLVHNCKQVLRGVPDKNRDSPIFFVHN